MNHTVGPDVSKNRSAFTDIRGQLPNYTGRAKRYRLIQDDVVDLKENRELATTKSYYSLQNFGSFIQAQMTLKSCYTDV